MNLSISFPDKRNSGAVFFDREDLHRLHPFPMFSKGDGGFVSLSDLLSIDFLYSKVERRIRHQPLLEKPVVCMPGDAIKNLSERGLPARLDFLAIVLYDPSDRLVAQEVFQLEKIAVPSGRG